MNYPDAENVPHEWMPNDVILDLYEVQEVTEGHGSHTRILPYHEGGFGRVYKVWHRSWNRHMAVKTPKVGLFETKEQKHAFRMECETWINLGIHPHLACCYYVRELGGVTRLFSEYADAGTLAEWITSGRLYEGDDNLVLARILDLALQFARGLAYAHEAGVIHQDVKPMNALMWKDATLKVSDFGISSIKTHHQNIETTTASKTFSVTAGPMTPSHCSPEQVARQKIDKRTDIWSWALCVFEMFNGGISWASGAVANHALTEYLESGAINDAIPCMPDDVVNVLRNCFKRNPEDRPQSIAFCAEQIEICICNYMSNYKVRSKPKNADISIANLNNKALSLIDLGQENRAIDVLSEAVKLNPSALSVVYNLSLLKWNMRMISDNQLITLIESVQSDHNLQQSILASLHYHLGNFVIAKKLAISSSIKNKSISNINKFLINPDAGFKKISNISINTETIGYIKDIAFFPDSKEIIILSDIIQRIDLQGQIITKYENPDIPVSKINVIHNGRFLIGFDTGKNSIFIWDAIFGSLIRRFTTQGRPLNVTEIPLLNMLIIEYVYDYDDNTLFGYQIVKAEVFDVLLSNTNITSKEKHIEINNKRVFGEFQELEDIKNIYFDKLNNSVNYDSIKYPDQLEPELAKWIKDKFEVVRILDKSQSSDSLLLKYEKFDEDLFVSMFLVVDTCARVIKRIFNAQDTFNALTVCCKISPNGKTVVGNIKNDRLYVWHLDNLTKAPYIYIEHEDQSTLEQRSREFQYYMDEAQNCIAKSQYVDALKHLKKARQIPSFMKNHEAKKLWALLKSYLPINGVINFEKNYVKISLPQERFDLLRFSRAIDLCANGFILLGAKNENRTEFMSQVIASNSEGILDKKFNLKFPSTNHVDALKHFTCRGNSCLLVEANSSRYCGWKKQIIEINLTTKIYRLVENLNLENCTNEINNFAVSDNSNYFACCRTRPNSFRFNNQMDPVIVWKYDTLEKIQLNLDKTIKWAVGISFISTSRLDGIIFGSNIGVCYHECSDFRRSSLFLMELIIYDFAISLDNNYIAVYCEENSCEHRSLRIYDVKYFEFPVCLYDLEFNSVNQLMFVERDQVLVVYTGNKVHFVNMNTGEVMKTIELEGEKFVYNEKEQELYFPQSSGFQKLKVDWDF